MLEKIYIYNSSHTDLKMYRCGIEDCSPEHGWGPGVRDHFLIHYILDGKGTFQVNGRSYHLQKNQGFLLCPNVVTKYQADALEPWSYCWVGFHGLKAETYLKYANLTASTPIFTYEKDSFLRDCFTQMVATKNLKRTREIRLSGFLYLLLSQLIETADTEHMHDSNENRKDLYMKKAIDFIEMNYSRKITISEIAHYIGLDRSYLYSLFKESLSSSPQDYLINYRIDKACGLMGNNTLSIGDISRSVGYEDPLLFSKVFKKTKGLSPRDFRKKKDMEKQ